MIDNEIPKHRKKKPSSTSKSKEKSNHKHEYVECLLINKESNKPYKAIYCKVCGKIYDVKMFETIEINECSNRCRLMNNEEIFEKYKDLEKYYVEDIWQKYVSISKEGGE